MGRPSSYTKKKGDAICLRLAQGDSLVKTCENDALPSTDIVFRWLRADGEWAEGFRNNYARARDIQAEYYAQDIVGIADEQCEDSTAVQRNRLRVDTRRWIASKLLPKKYGDKIDVTSGGEKLEGVQITINRGDDG